MSVVDRDIGISAAALFPAILLAVLSGEYDSGQLARTQFLPILVFCLAAILLIILMSMGKRVYSETGITKQFLWIRKHYTWDQVIQVGSIHLDTDPSVKQFAFTFSGGTPWKEGKVTRKGWMAVNGNKCLCAKYSEELHSLILRCYGPLDF